MKAVYIEEFGAAENLSIRTVADPSEPHGDEVLVRVRAAALNRADLLQRRGLYPAPAGYPERPPLHTSSVGRLFDAVAALLGLCTHNTYEGEASMLLETLAATGRCEERYRVHWRDDKIDEKNLIRWIITDLKHHVNKDEIAFKFHEYLADVISEVMHKYKFHQVALSGGVFQNALLVELIWEKLHQHNRIFTHHELSPNDENIAVGQLGCIALAKKKENLALSFAVNLK